MALTKYYDKNQLKDLQNTGVGIAGLGGLGSNIALMLARSGIIKMRLIDFDFVEATNLNRQQYWPSQIGKKKTIALSENLLALNPEMQLDLCDVKLSNQNLEVYLRDYDIWAEAFDDPQMKSFFVECALKKSQLVVSGNGLCGYGGSLMQKQRHKNLHIVGDFCTSSDKLHPFAPRVTQAAAIMADTIFEFILNKSL